MDAVIQNLQQVLAQAKQLIKYHRPASTAAESDKVNVVEGCPPNFKPCDPREMAQNYGAECPEKGLGPVILNNKGEQCYPEGEIQRSIDEAMKNNHELSNRKNLLEIGRHMAVLVAMNKRLQEYFLSEKDGMGACGVFNDSDFVNSNDAAQIPNWCGHMPVMASKGAESGFDPETGKPSGRSNWQEGKAKNLGCAWRYSNGIGPNLQASNDQEKYAGQCVPMNQAGDIVDGLGNADRYNINGDTDIGANPTDAQKQVIDFAARHLQQMLKMKKDGLRNDNDVQRARDYVKYAQKTRGNRLMGEYFRLDNADKLLRSL